MTERRPGPRAASGPARRRSGAVAPAGRPADRRAPGPLVATVLALLLGVSGAVWLTGRPAATRPQVGSPAALAPAAAGTSREPGADRADRGEPRTPLPTTPGRGAGQAVPSAGSLQPSRPPTPPPTRSGEGRPVAAGAPAGAGSPAAEVVRLTNAERASAGCGPLRIDPRLTTAAQEHSEDMADRGYFSHTTPEGRTPWDRAHAAGYPDPSAENIAMGYRTAADVVAGWMGSAGHRANILNCSSHAVGVGLDTHGFYWTQLFGYI